MIREMGELTIARYDIAKGKYIFRVRPTIWVCDNSSCIEIDPYFFEIESLYIRYTTEGEEDMRVLKFLSFLRRQESRFLCTLDYQLLLIPLHYIRIEPDIYSCSL